MRPKYWQITSAEFDIDRLRSVLCVLNDFEGDLWNKQTRSRFLVFLIHRQLICPLNNNFYADIMRKELPLVAKGEQVPTMQSAKEIFAHIQYKKPCEQAQRIVRPLVKFGFLSLHEGRVKITSTGHALIRERTDYGEIVLRFLLKWQLPNPLEPFFSSKKGFNIKPFIGTLHLIRETDRLCKTQRGLSLREFALFGLTLIDWRHIKDVARKVVSFRANPANVPNNTDLQILETAAERTMLFFRQSKYVRIQNSHKGITIR